MKQKFLHYIRWLGGGFFFLLAFAVLIDGAVLASASILALAFLVTPLSQKYLFSKLKFPIPTWSKFFLGMILFFTFAMSLPPTPPQQVAIDVEINKEVSAEEPEEQPSESEKTYYKVTSITDGDTIKVLINNKTETVRLANINTPESVDSRRPVECMGEEASKKMTELVSGKKIYMEIDETQSDKDQYNRLLRFIFLEDDTDVGLEMVRHGYAQSSPYGSSSHKYLAAYTAAQEIARANKLGLWNPDVCPSPTIVSLATPTPDSLLEINASQHIQIYDSSSKAPVPPVTQPNSSGLIKKSINDICHAPGTTYYDRTTNYTAYNSIDECLASGGRLPKR